MNGKRIFRTDRIIERTYNAFVDTIQYGGNSCCCEKYEFITFGGTLNAVQQNHHLYAYLLCLGSTINCGVGIKESKPYPLGCYFERSRRWNVILEASGAVITEIKWNLKFHDFGHNTQLTIRALFRGIDSWLCTSENLWTLIPFLWIRFMNRNEFGMRERSLGGHYPTTLHSAWATQFMHLIIIINFIFTNSRFAVVEK